MADLQFHHPDEQQRKFAADMMALMTPIVKAFITDNGFECASECLGVLGGHGYVREWGMEQFVRDARINMIYEGTNTIQSLDLLGRKVLMDNGARLKAFGKLITEFIEENGGGPGVRLHPEVNSRPPKMAKFQRFSGHNREQRDGTLRWCRRRDRSCGRTLSVRRETGRW